MGRKNNKASNIVFKCNYCDGGETSEYFGFHGVCSDKMISYNVEVAKHAWCSDENCACKQYHNGEISRSELLYKMENSSFVCYESTVLSNWIAQGGYTKSGDPRLISRAQKNSLAVLTTRKPCDTEEKRFIFAVFLIGEHFKGDDSKRGYVHAAPYRRIELTKQEAYKLPFWKYHRSRFDSVSPAGAHDLFQYISDEKAVQILKDIVTVIAPEDKDYARECLQYYCKIHHINAEDVPPPEGALMRKK
ncbi:MAG: hypothetical protein K2H29_08500 [Oscillospiraceae bacterium]|nr:hypothetical protein [Oscillospiraceae bacterium]